VSVCYDVPVTTLQITLDDDVYDRLAARARQRSLTVEQMVEQAAAAEAADDDGLSDEEFETLVDEMIETYRPVFHRLAQ
jgi:predicted transcriptional regulator